MTSNSLLTTVKNRATYHARIVSYRLGIALKLDGIVNLDWFLPSATCEYALQR